MTLSVGLSKVEICNNLGEIQHWDLIKRFFEKSDEVILVSPFIFDDFSVWLDSLNIETLKSFTLVTTLSPKGDDQLKKPSALISLVRYLKQNAPNVLMNIHINNNLHGKVYLFKSDDECFTGIVTSANLTHSGLKRNHEWGTIIKDKESLSDLENEIESCLEYKYIPLELLLKLEIFADQHKRYNPEMEVVNVDADLLNALKQFAPRARKLSKEIDPSKTDLFFLKPWGTKDEPVRIEDEINFGDQKGTLDFPKGRPANITPSSIVITFGTGCRSILSVYQVLSHPEERSEELQRINPDAKRWPWYVQGHNYSPDFGSSWWTHNITIDALAEEFLQNNPSTPLTNCGSQTLGVFNFGAGRLALSREFGTFIFNQIIKIENTLSTSLD